MEHGASAERICRNDGRVCAMQSAGYVLLDAFCSAYLHLHSNVVLDLELDLWFLHTINMMQSILFFTDSTDHLHERAYYYERAYCTRTSCSALRILTYLGKHMKWL